MLYRLLKQVIGFGMRLYYREIRIKNRDVLNQHNGPMIIISNHPNTMMDGWLIGKACNRQLHYMAKGTFFNTAWKRKVLTSLGLVPINRQTDGQTKGVSNTDSFEACYRILEEGKTLVIFPEGNSFQERGLRELKTGTARIALEAQNRNDGRLDLVVIPVGLFYTQAHRFRSSILINVGEPIKVEQYLDQYSSDRSKAAHALTDCFRQELEKLLILNAGEEREELLEVLVSILYDDDKEGVITHAERINSLNNILANIQLTDPRQMERIQVMVDTYLFEKEQLSLKDEFLGKGGRKGPFIKETALTVLYILIGLPLFMFGFVHSILPFKLTDRIIPRLTKDIEYYAPLAILLGLILYPLNYGLLLWFVDRLFDLEPLLKMIYFVMMPVTGLYAYYYVHLFQAFQKRMRFLSKRKDHREELKILKNIHTELRQIILRS